MMPFLRWLAVTFSDSTFTSGRATKLREEVEAGG
jgi:hypothetical protein